MICQSNQHRTYCTHFLACQDDHYKVQRTWSRASSRAKLVPIFGPSPFRQDFVLPVQSLHFPSQGVLKTEEVHAAPLHSLIGAVWHHSATDELQGK
jgi:hypothetical protein